MIIKVNKADGKVFLPDKYLARDNDNLIQIFEVEFDDEFLRGIGQLDYILPSGEKGYINMELNEQTYSVPIYNSICKEGILDLQFLVFLNARFIKTSDEEINPNHTYFIKEGDTYVEVENPTIEDIGSYYVESVPLYHSKMFTLTVDPSINAELEENEQYPTKIALINAKLKEVEDALEDCEEATEGAERVNISQTKTGNTLYVTTTDRNGDTDTKEVYDGADGKDAKINGYNTITIVEGTKIDIEQEDNVLTINNTLSKTSELINDSGYITKDVNDLTNYSTTTEMNSAIGDETTNRQIADNNLQTQIDAITSASDVVDVVSTYQDLLDYDTSKLTDKDVIKVMQDSTHSNAISYYRWTSNSWSYIGSEGPFYTKGETDTLLNTKQDLIDNSHKLSSDLVDDSGTNKFVTATDKTNWNAKYDKPSGGIPSSDMTTAVQTSLGKADTAIQDVSGKEDKTNKVSTIDENSTNTQYVGAKCVYDSQVAQDTQITQLQAENDYLNSVIEQAFDETTQTGETISIDNTIQAKMKVGLNGNTSQETTTGANIQKYTARSYSFGGNEYICLSDGQAKITGTGTSTITNLTYNQTATDSMILEAGTYTLKLIGTIDANVNLKVMGSNISLDGNNEYQFTLNEQTTDFYVSFYVNAGTHNSNFYITLASGTTATTERYTNGASPNPSYPQPIQVVSGDNEVKEVGENLLDENYYNNSSLYTKDGSFYCFVELPKEFKTKFYCNMSIKGSNQNLVFGFTSTMSGTFQGGIRVLNNGTLNSNVECDFTNADHVYLAIGNGNQITPSTDVSKIFDNYNIICSTISNPQYKPYTSSSYQVNLGDIELCKIGDYQDKFFKAINGNTIYDNLDSTIKNTLDYGEWYLKKNIGKVVLDGSEEWGLDTNKTLTQVYKCINTPNRLLGYRGFYSNYFINQPGDTEKISLSDSNIDYHIYLALYKSTASTIQELETWLSTHNTIVYYVLATPTYTKITGTLETQLEAIYNAMSKKRQTNITQVNNDKPFIIDAWALTKGSE